MTQKTRLFVRQTQSVVLNLFVASLYRMNTRSVVSGDRAEQKKCKRELP